jgi:formate hydrogenlyase subunit 4
MPNDYAWLVSSGMGALQLVGVISLAPLLQGCIKTIKARCQHRQGPSPLQPYYDLLKYWRKGSVVSDQASWIFTLTPFMVFGCMLALTLVVPVVGAAPLGGWDDLLLLLGILALARVMLVLAGLDTGSAFGGMGSSREMLVSVLVEPGLLVVLVATALRANSTSLSVMVHNAVVQQGMFVPAALLVGLAFILILLAETGRLPVDNPDTHLELTMIHEGMLLEYAGRPLALLLWATWIKQFLLLALLVNLFVPWGASLGTDGSAWVLNVLLLGGKLLGVAVGVSAIEMLEPKMRLFLLPRFLGAAFLVAVLGMLLPSFLR